MAVSRDSGSPYLKWYLIIVYLAVPTIVLLTFFSDAFETEKPGQIPEITWLLGSILLLFTLIMILAKIINLSNLLDENNDKLDKLAEAQEKNRAVSAD